MLVMHWGTKLRLLVEKIKVKQRNAGKTAFGETVFHLPQVADMLGSGAGAVLMTHR